MRYLFLGGPWHLRAQEVDPLPHIVVPDVEHDWWTGATTFSEHTYTGHRFTAALLHPCVRSVHVVGTWQVYVKGEPIADPPSVLSSLRRQNLPVQRWEWKPQLQRLDDVPDWAWEVRP